MNNINSAIQAPVISNTLFSNFGSSNAFLSQNAFESTSQLPNFIGSNATNSNFLVSQNQMFLPSNNNKIQYPSVNPSSNMIFTTEQTLSSVSQTIAHNKEPISYPSSSSSAIEVSKGAKTEFIRELAEADFKSGTELIKFLTDHSEVVNKGYLHVIEVKDFIPQCNPTCKTSLLLYFSREIAKLFIEKYIYENSRNVNFCAIINQLCFSDPKCVVKSSYPICGENIVIAIMRSNFNPSKEMNEMLTEFFPPDKNPWNVAKADTKGDSITGNFSANCVLKKNNEKFTTTDENGVVRQLQFNSIYDQRENLTHIIKAMVEHMVVFMNLETSEEGKFCEFLSPAPTAKQRGQDDLRSSVSPSIGSGSGTSKKNSFGIFYSKLFLNSSARSNAPKDLLSRADAFAKEVQPIFKEYIVKLFTEGINDVSILDKIKSKYEIKHPRELTSVTNSLFRVLFSVYPFFISEEFVSIRNTLFRSIETVRIPGKNPILGETRRLSHSQNNLIIHKDTNSVTTVAMPQPSSVTQTDPREVLSAYQMNSFVSASPGSYGNDSYIGSVTPNFSNHLTTSSATPNQPISYYQSSSSRPSTQPAVQNLNFASNRMSSSPYPYYTQQNYRQSIIAPPNNTIQSQQLITYPNQVLFQQPTSQSLQPPSSFFNNVYPLQQKRN